jgi:hypothetical protein
VDSNKCSEGLGFDHFYVQSPCDPLIEDYAEVFYMLRTESESESESELRYYRRTIGQSALEQSTHLGLTTRFLLLPENCLFVDVGRPL